VLDIALRNVTFRHDGGFALREVTLTFPRSTHTAIAGPAACGASTLLALIAGTLRPQSGDIILGQRRVNDLKAANRPLLFATSAIDVPQRWSVQHALIAAVRTRKLDREDRHQEYALAAEKWELAPLLERRITTLSSTERARVHFARIELLRPAILIADRILEGVSASAHMSLTDMFFRTLRVHGTTVVFAPSSRDELAMTDLVVALNHGRVTQTGTAAEVFARPGEEGAALAAGEVDEIPIDIRGNTVESVIGSWEVDPPPFQGSGIALVRPSDFAPAKPGEDSDVIFGVEEAGFVGGRWLAHGVLSGGVTLRVELPVNAGIHKGKLMALRYDPARFTLIPRTRAPLQTTVPTDVVPPMRDTR
jgi:ABC-type sugar transport system ATPase subunit